MNARITNTLLAGAVLIMASSAKADIVKVYYSDFSDTSNIQLNGDAAVYTPNSESELRLTGGNISESGSAFLLDPISLSNDASFSAFFSFNIHASQPGADADGFGADGFTFTLQTVSNTSGTGGGGLGYSGIGSSMAVEFDTWLNPAADDISGNHVGINLNGSVNSLASTNEVNRFNDGDSWYAWIDYNGSSDDLNVRYSLYPTRPDNASLTYTVDLAGVFNSQPVYVGFTGSSGSGASQSHNIEQFAFENEYKTLVEQGSVSDVPVTGGTLSLLLSCLFMGTGARKGESSV